METIIFFSLVALITVLVLIYREAKKRYFNPWKDEMDNGQPKTEERPDSFGHNKALADMAKITDRPIAAVGIMSLLKMTIERKKRAKNVFQQRTKGNDEEIDEFLKRVWDEKERSDRVFEERMIELSRQKHRFDKLKAPKPKWIQQ